MADFKSPTIEVEFVVRAGGVVTTSIPLLDFMEVLQDALEESNGDVATAHQSVMEAIERLKRRVS